ncbi:hypothetical protein Tco_1009968 [Tanacetum coccineum]
MVRRWSATVDRRWPPLTAAVDRWSGGGSGDGAGDNWQATWHHSGGDMWHSNDWVSDLQVRYEVTRSDTRHSVVSSDPIIGGSMNFMEISSTLNYKFAIGLEAL